MFKGFCKCLRIHSYLMHRPFRKLHRTCLLGFSSLRHKMWNRFLVMMNDYKMRF